MSSLAVHHVTDARTSGLIDVVADIALAQGATTELVNEARLLSVDPAPDATGRIAVLLDRRRSIAEITATIDRFLSADPATASPLVATELRAISQDLARVATLAEAIVRERPNRSDVEELERVRSIVIARTERIATEIAKVELPAHASRAALIQGAFAFGGFLIGIGYLVFGVFPSRRQAFEEAQRLSTLSNELLTLSAFARHTSNAAIVCDLNGRIKWVNAAFEKLTGYTLSEAKGRKPGDLLQYEGTDPGTVARISAAVRAKQPIRCEIKNRAKDGRTYWLDMDLQPLADPSGTIYGFMAVEAEITALKEMAEQLAEANDDLEMMSTLARVGAWAVDLTDQTILWSREVRRIHAVDEAFVPDMESALSFYPVEAREALVKALDQCIAEHRPWDGELPFIAADGTPRWVRIHAAIMARDAGKMKLIGAFQDITETVAAREEILVTKQRLELTTESAAIGLWDFDAATGTLWISPSWWANLGLDAERRPTSLEASEAFVHPDDLPSLAMAREALCATPPRQYSCEYRHRDGTGAWRWLLATGRATEHNQDGSAKRLSGVLIDIHERKLAAERISHAASHDVLTGLANRSEFRRRLQKVLAATGENRHAAVFVMDLDHFKVVNDTFGHAIGDRMLVGIAERIRGALQDGDVVARLGGDEFALLLDRPGSEIREEAAVIAARLLASITEPFEIEGRNLHVGVSIGIAVSADDALEPDTLIRNADSALYKVKGEGKLAYRFFDEQLAAEAAARRGLAADLRDALAKGELALDFQPIVLLSNKKLVGAEALLRWRHPTLGNVPPSQFIPIAEETGLIVPIGNWVIEQACMAAAKWPGRVVVAVNISMAQLGKTNIVETVTTALSRSGLPANRLELEVTESIFLRNDETILADLHHLDSLGVRLALDDFGTGYSSLGYLQKLPFKKIKIDKSFIDHLSHDAQSAAVVCAVASLARGLDMETTAEGIETETQAQLVLAAGCTQGQGYHFGRPMPADVLAELPSIVGMPPIRQVA